MPVLPAWTLFRHAGCLHTILHMHWLNHYSSFCRSYDRLLIRTRCLSTLGKPCSSPISYCIILLACLELGSIPPCTHQPCQYYQFVTTCESEESKGSQQSAAFCSLPDTDSRCHRINGEVSTSGTSPLGRSTLEHSCESR
mgnify:CR=1 FL=1